MTEPDTEELEQRLIAAAIEAMPHAYAPYSNYTVGCALLAGNGKIYTGVNVENASYPEGTCAEAGAIAAMVRDGETRIRAVAVAGKEGDIITPCGGCRQRLSEFAPPATVVLACGPQGLLKRFVLGDLLPHAFTPEHLE